MGIFDLLLLAIALAMDCFTVSIVSGVITKRALWGTILRMSLLFGIFQAAMPLIGWLGTTHFSQYIEVCDHWIAFALLAFLGGKMIRESFQPEEEKKFDPIALRTQIVLAFATSIDALAIGITFAFTGYRTIHSLTLPLFIIGIVSLLFGIAGNLLGIRFGNSISKRLKPELFGGIILVLIGMKVLVSHLFGL
jgi:putative Mn2+ efflux pump MntP